MTASDAMTVKTGETARVLLISPLQGSAALCALHQGDQMLWKQVGCLMFCMSKSTAQSAAHSS